MNHDVMLRIYGDSLKFLKDLLKDVPEERWAEQPAGLPNHPAWTLTHLCVANDFALQSVGRQPVCPPAWSALSGPGSKPVSDRKAYPSAEELWGTLSRQHTAVEEGVRSAPPGHFDTPSPESIRGFAPTLGHIAAFMLMSHEFNHLGQLQAWKRAAGLMKP